MFGLSSPKAMYHFRFKIRSEGVRSIYDIIYTKFTALAKLINGPLRIGLLMVNDAHTRLSEETRSLGHNFQCKNTSELFKCHEDSVNIQALSRIVDDFQRNFERERGSMLQLVRFMYSCQPASSNFAVNKKKKAESTKILSVNYPLDYNGMVDYLVTDRIQPKHPESALKRLLVDCGLPEYLDGDGIDEFINTCFLQNYRQAKMNEYISLNKKNEIIREDEELKFVDEMYCEMHGIDKDIYKAALKKMATIPEGIRTIFGILDKKTEVYLKNGIVEGNFCKLYNIELAHPVEHDKFLIFPNGRMIKEFDIDGNITRCSIDAQSTYVLHYLVFRKSLGTVSWNSVDSDGTIKVIRQIGVPNIPSDEMSSETEKQLTVLTTGLETRAKKSIVDCGVNENCSIVGLIKLTEGSNPDLNYPFILDPNYGEVYIENNLDDYFVADKILIHNHFNIAGTISRDNNKIMCFKISSQKIEKIYKLFNL
ncbi:Hypothetical protein SRAE_2000101500 [Strongyloides ratti]|uniref:Uncharacterized protein n=1 Tax=Strongyloides ratti TaxID=34506 RepID=A0A090LFS7_STRRB|nr:Hypothetical protein SRAE_2000101500 [Strongyloides ratti]CEF66345.1 Hypothetical protein SRAE_2000101500 [Strongyloides ratti]